MGQSLSGQALMPGRGGPQKAFRESSAEGDCWQQSAGAGGFKESWEDGM